MSERCGHSSAGEVVCESLLSIIVPNTVAFVIVSKALLSVVECKM